MNSELVNKLMGDGYNCSQTVLLYFKDRFNLDENIAKRIAQGFESGMFNGSVCGAVSGAYMVLSLEYGDGSKNTRTLLKDKINEFLERFKKDESSIICEDLLGINIKEDENLQKAFNDGTIVKVCPKAITKSIEILEDMLKNK